MRVLGGSAAVALVCLPVLYRMALRRSGHDLAPTRTSVGNEKPALDAQDTFGDGTPDFLRLNSAPDQEAFRNWFTLLAEYQALRPANEVPGEISDCAALLRYAYRNALHKHDRAWFRENRFAPPAALPSVEKYHYPSTPLGAALFRVRPGAFRMTDLADGTFSEFADARTLELLNTHLVSKDVRMARPGDLLFYRQLEQDSPFHSMIFVGRSQWVERGTENAQDLVVYHTGRIDRHTGEMRRLPLAELLRHPLPRWRPVAGNSNFLGVYRWNILRETN